MILLTQQINRNDNAKGQQARTWGFNTEDKNSEKSIEKATARHDIIIHSIVTVTKGTMRTHIQY